MTETRRRRERPKKSDRLPHEQSAIQSYRDSLAKIEEQHEGPKQRARRRHLVIRLERKSDNPSPALDRFIRALRARQLDQRKGRDQA